MKKYNTPEIEVTTFSAEAILLTSTVGALQEDFDGLTYEEVFGTTP